MLYRMHRAIFGLLTTLLLSRSYSSVSALDESKQCSFFAEFGYAYPTETCTKQQFATTDDNTASAVIYHCSQRVEDVDYWQIEKQYFDTSECIGDPQRIESKICRDSYCNCRGTPAHCQIATIVDFKNDGTNCTNSMLSKYTYVVDQCVSYNTGTSTKLHCDDTQLTDLSFVSHDHCDSMTNPSESTFNEACVSVTCNGFNLPQNPANRIHAKVNAIFIAFFLIFITSYV
mmetsp:Transcript_21920/g.35197  ORF Transcript_21920/g.35197 Transcript_21920/m.35197 type:complete len:230 (+) Transcript_21920:48-737(+)